MTDMTKLNATAHVMPGYVCKGYIRPMNYVHGPVKWHYKVMPSPIRRKFFKELNKRPPGEDKDKYQAEIVAGLIVDWNQTYNPKHDKAGEPLPITPQNFLELDETVGTRMINIIFRLTESDIDPEDHVSEQDKVSERQEWDAQQLLAEVDAAHQAQVGN